MFCIRLCSMIFVLKSVLSDNMSIATPAFFSFLFAWNIFSHHPTFNLCVSFALKWVTYRQHIEGSCFFIQPSILCLLIGVYLSIDIQAFKVIIYRSVFFGFFFCHFKPCFPVHLFIWLCWVFVAACAIF